MELVEAGLVKARYVVIRSHTLRDVRGHCEYSLFILLDVVTTLKMANAFDQLPLRIATRRGEALLFISLPFHRPLLFLNEAVVQSVGKAVGDLMLCV